MSQYHLFISHSWTYSDHYDGLVNLLDQAPRFQYTNLSIPEDDPAHVGSKKELSRAIRNQMESCGILLVLAGVYATYSKWIEKEMNIARSSFPAPKPILAIRPFGGVGISNEVRAKANRIVDWNTNSIVNAIRELA